MVLRKVSTIIPLGNLAKRGTSKAFETKSRIGSEPGSLRDRDSWISGMDGFEECEVSARGPRMECSVSNVRGMSFLFGGLVLFCYFGGWAGNSVQVIPQDLGNHGWGRSLLPADSVVSLYNAFVEVFEPMYHQHLRIALFIPRTATITGK